MDKITVKIVNEKLWEKCYPNMEMICKKLYNIVCPVLMFQVGGLDESKMYEISISFERMDEFRYSFNKNGKSWNRDTAKQKSYDLTMKFYNRGEPRSGKDIMKEPISFEEIRITCGLNISKDEHVFYLRQNHKYLPILLISNPEVPEEKRKFRMELAQFITVAKYQHNKMGLWKSDPRVFPSLREWRVRNQRQQEALENTDVPMCPGNQPALSLDENSQFVGTSTGYFHGGENGELFEFEEEPTASTSTDQHFDGFLVEEDLSIEFDAYVPENQEESIHKDPAMMEIDDSFNFFGNDSAMLENPAFEDDPQKTYYQL